MHRHERNFVGAILCGFAALFLLWSVYDMFVAWFAPRCGSVTEIRWFSWCLPIGFEGPFADVWANRSFANARIWAATSLIFTSLFCGALVHISFFQSPASFPKRLLLLVVLTIGVVLLRGYALNSYS